MKMIETIRDAYGELTASEKRIFQLMHDDLKGFALMSITDVAHELKISKTTLMRFAKRCGYSGYAKFKKALQREVLLDVSPVRKIKDVISSEYSLNMAELLEQEMLNLTTTFDALGQEDLTVVVEMILASGEMFTLSWGVSGTIAEIFSHRLRLMGIRCTNLRRNHGLLLEETALLQADDLVVVFELPPYNTEMIETVKRLKEKKVRIVTVTDSPGCPLTKDADFSFFCGTEAMFFGNSLSGPLFWVNLISSLIIYRKKDRVVGILEERQRFFNDEKYYYHLNPAIG
jgi:DNA-binding MurR/RpiR family transcriptional regulator